MVELSGARKRLSLALYLSRVRSSEVLGIRPIPTAELTQVVLDWMSRSRDVKPTVSSINDERRIPYDRVTRVSSLYVD